MESIMRNISSKYWLAGVLFLLVGWVQPAKAFLGVGDVVTDPGLTSQTIAAEAARAGQTLTMIQNQFQQIQNAIQNTMSLADPVFAPLGNTIRSLNNMYMQGQSLMWRAQNIDQQFAMMNPGYNSYLYSMGRGGTTMSSLYQKWSDQGNQTTRSALLGAGIQIDDAANGQSMLEKLTLQSTMAGGQMQALQAANQIALSQAQQMQELRVLMAQQTILHAEYMAQQNARLDASNAWQIQFRGNNPLRTPGQGF
jgi:P-type conjugative transfer protein TrbJ